MNKLLVTLSFLISIICLTSQSWALPKCIGLWSTSNWNNCFGTYVWKSGKHKGDKYVGEHKDGLAYGQGTYFFVNGDKYIGEWKENKEHGQGTYFYPSGDKYIGLHNNGKRHGQGIYTYANRDKYTGEHKNGKMHGQGIFIFNDGSKDVGEFKTDKLNGYAIRYDPKGNILKEGIWKNDKFMYAKKLIPTSPSNSKIEEYKNFCSDIGFTPGTEKFGECVVEAMKKG